MILSERILRSASKFWKNKLFAWNKISLSNDRPSGNYTAMQSFFPSIYLYLWPTCLCFEGNASLQYHRIGLHWYPTRTMQNANCIWFAGFHVIGLILLGMADKLSVQITHIFMQSWKGVNAPTCDGLSDIDSGLN